MGRLLELLRTESAHGANPANPANLPAQTAQDSQISKISAAPQSGFTGDAPRVAESQESQGLSIPTDTPAIRAELLTLAASIATDPALIRALPEADLAACEGLPDSVLRTYIMALEVEAERMAGRVPPGHTAAVHCARCGPVWLHPDVAAVLPVVDGWPRALGGPWCHVRKAGGYIPRPSVTCDDCRHFTRDTINPAAGVGTCTAGHGTHWPMQRHRCGHFQPNKGTP